MVLKKLSRGLNFFLALILSVLSTGILQTVPVSAASVTFDSRGDQNMTFCHEGSLNTEARKNFFFKESMPPNAAKYGHIQSADLNGSIYDDYARYSTTEPNGHDETKPMDAYPAGAFTITVDGVATEVSWDARNPELIANNCQPLPAAPTVSVNAIPCVNGSATTSVSGSITNTDDLTNNKVKYSWKITLQGSSTVLKSGNANNIEDGQSGSFSATGLGAGQYTISVTGDDNTSTSANFTIDTCAHDACPNLSGNQPIGTSCTAPADDKETRSLPAVVNCGDDTVTIQNQERTRTYSWNGSAWVAGEWSAWTNTTQTVTPATDEQCPPHDECPLLSGNQPAGTSCTAPANDRETRNLDGVVNCQEDTYTIVHQERTRSYTWDGDSWEAGAWSNWTTYDTTVTAATNEQCPKEEEPKKVFVCKYVGTPGIDERLQTGQNPISVSVNAIQNNQWDGTVPGWFSDAHDRSYVLAYDVGQPEPSISECPSPEEPDSDISFSVICTANGGRVTLVNDGDGDGSALVNGVSYDVPANDSVTVDLPFTTGFTLSGTVVIDGETSLFSKDCTPGQGGEEPETPTTPGQTLGTSTTTTPQVLSTSTELPTTLPATGASSNPLMIVLASLVAYGAAYFLQGRRQLARDHA